MTEAKITNLVAKLVKDHGHKNLLQAIARGFVLAGDEYDPQDRHAILYLDIADVLDRISCRMSR